MSTSRIGERHAGNLGGRLSDATTGINVVIAVENEYAHFISVQHLVWMLVNLLTRQPHEVRHIGLEFPADVKTIPRLSPLVDNGPFRERLFEAAARINPYLNGRASDAPHMFIRVGPGGLDESMPSLAVSCDNWSGYVGSRSIDIITDSENPIGPYVAACLCAGEVFKFARTVRADAGNSPLSLWLNAYTLRISEQLSPSPPSPVDIRFPSTALAGVGAVGSAFLHLLYAMPALRGRMDVIDGDPEGVTDTNLNRYAIFDLRHTEVLHLKASTAAAMFAGTGTELIPFDKTWQEWRALDQSMPKIVISAVDNNAARHAIQDLMPNTILGGSTNELKLQVNYFDVSDPASACLKCGNPVDTRATPDDEIIGRLKALTADELIAAAQKIEVDAENLRNFLSDPKKNCGLISGESLQRFEKSADAGTWSVGFVSILAGVLLGAEFVKQVEGAEMRMRVSSNMFRFQFWRPDRSTVNRLTSAQPEASCVCRLPYYQSVIAEQHLDVP